MAEYLEITELRDEIVLCRTLGHSWDDNPNGAVNKLMFQGSKGVLTLRCTRCTTERVDYISEDDRVGSRSYAYPSGYKSVPGQGTRPNLRGEMFRRGLLIKAYQRASDRRARRRG
jgi:hypothetical protein